MAELPIVLVAYFFGAASFAWTHAWIVVPVMVAAWLLLFVPSEKWARIRTTRTTPASPAQRVKSNETARHQRSGVLVHSR